MHCETMLLLLVIRHSFCIINKMSCFDWYIPRRLSFEWANMDMMLTHKSLVYSSIISNWTLSRVFSFLFVFYFQQNLCANSVKPDLTSRSTASDLGLHCLPISLLLDARHKWSPNGLLLIILVFCLIRQKEKYGWKQLSVIGLLHKFWSKITAS